MFLRRALKWLLIIAVVTAIGFGGFVFYIYKNMPPEAIWTMEYAQTKIKAKDVLADPEKYAAMPCIKVELHDGKDKFCFDRSRVIDGKKYKNPDGTEALVLDFVSKLVPEEKNLNNVLSLSLSDQDFTNTGDKITIAEYFAYNLIVSSRENEKSYKEYEQKFNQLYENPENNGKFIDISHIKKYRLQEGKKMFVLPVDGRIHALLGMESNQVYKRIGHISFQTPKMPMYIETNYRTNIDRKESEFLGLLVNLAKEGNEFIESSRVK